MVAFAVPDGDSATGLGWSTSGFARLDEGAPGGGDVASQASNNDTEFLVKTTTDVTDPEVSTGHITRVRWRKPSGNRQTDGVLQLYQGDPDAGGTLIITTIETNLGNSLVITTEVLPDATADNITDYTDLYIRVYYQYQGGGSPGSFEVDFFELEVPDPAPVLLIPPRQQLTTVRM